MSISELEAANINVGKMNFREDDISFTGGADSEYMEQVLKLASGALEYDVELNLAEGEPRPVAQAGGAEVGHIPAVEMTVVEEKMAAQIVDEATGGVENLADMLDSVDLEDDVTGNAETAQKNDADDTLLLFVEDTPTDFEQYLGSGAE